jgi:hypothetical protein
MPLAAMGVGLGTAIAGAASAGGAVAGGVLAARGASKGAEIQDRAAMRALDFEERQYADEQARLEPYRQVGSSAYGQLAKTFGLDMPAPSTSPTGGGTFNFAQPMRSAGLPGQPQAAQRVPLTAPDGSTAMVPAHKVPMYRARWAAMAGGGAPTMEARV